ncbi:cyclic nucleotide-binding domain-containing protein [Halobacteriovorax sp. GB3]|uniref:cyclic nucleotide-binding domain-containing protein n=1 Tax=Halobacteriovorax sp. GB3 TaxID=2719615 RepID=UPI002360663C|nr:cyclic nucleotide-binding domain-containing protein [Halobacteriovorax sp. GB3]MDD0853393.1 cyclic nucleotide-binding domain-containing protein [Halobacteriovorax sp. GB3]
MKRVSEENIIELDDSTICEIEQAVDTHTFPIQSDLFYEGQIPIVGYLLLDGHVQMLRNKKVKAIISKGTLFGVKELMTNSPSHYSAQILPGTKVCFLDKSSVLEFIEKHQGQDIGELFQKLIKT